uniref:ORF6N domain-containing protein n=1 Tax=uncultured Tenacibaculum sp. TaxID=174713 RepID=UPI00262380EA|nr:ORF6N domain-containing protein [uncultured Tenacibaculum sp.]
MSKEIINIDVETRIFNFRGLQVMIDRDLAELYQVETKRLNEQVKRNINRFPNEFRFQLNNDELNELVANCDRFEKLKHSSSTPYVFTEQGVAMLSAVLRSDIAIKVSIQIIKAFVQMRSQINNNQLLISRVDKMEQKQLKTDQQLEKIFKALESKKPQKDKGVFFEGQVFDAYAFVAELIRDAKKSIRLIDNYIDETVLTLLSKRKDGVNCAIYSKNISKQLKLDLKKHNEQYPNITFYEFKEAHDRFLIVDDVELYHIGASLKDLGKKWFAFSKMNTETVTVLDKLKSIGV